MNPSETYSIYYNSNNNNNMFLLNERKSKIILQFFFLRKCDFAQFDSQSTSVEISWENI